MHVSQILSTFAFLAALVSALPHEFDDRLYERDAAVTDNGHLYERDAYPGLTSGTEKLSDVLRKLGEKLDKSLDNVIQSPGKGTWKQIQHMGDALGEIMKAQEERNATKDSKNIENFMMTMTKFRLMQLELDEHQKQSKKNATQKDKIDKDGDTKKKEKTRRANLDTRKASNTVGDVVQYLSNEFEDQFEGAETPDDEKTQKIMQFTESLLRSNLKQCHQIIKHAKLKHVDAGEADQMFQKLGDMFASSNENTSKGDMPKSIKLMQTLIKNNVEQCRKMIKDSNDTSRRLARKRPRALKRVLKALRWRRSPNNS
ncbi:hypothetical protein MMC13_004298 [Lambiella insularis]|nr:hypothetical protein [Lambiella insularis]